MLATSLALFSSCALFQGTLPRPSDFGSELAWDDAYRSMTEHDGEWLLPYATVRPWLLARLPVRRCAVLELGCGTSSMAAELTQEHGAVACVVSIDSSAVAVNLAQQRFSHLQNLLVRKADARDNRLSSGSFGAVVDKGTLDAICTSEGFDYEAKRVAKECARVLVRGGVWLCVSLMPPSVALPLMQHDGALWSSVDAQTLSDGVYGYALVRREGGS